MTPAMTPAPLLSPWATSPILAANGKPSRVRQGSLGQKEAEAHVPRLKNQGKSDCVVRIIGIHDVHTGIPVDDLSASNACK